MPGPARLSAPVRVLIVDNYDSFTYNTVQLLEFLGARCEVRLNDRIGLPEIERLDPQGLLFSAGPGTPDEAGITLAAIRHFAGRVPVLGVCLGHQAIAQAFGGRVVRAERLMHGKVCAVSHLGTGLFEGLPQPTAMARYNSLLVEESSLPAALRVTARSETGEVMAIAHETWPLEGIQFHPESVLSANGARLLDNWLAQL